MKKATSTCLLNIFLFVLLICVLFAPANQPLFAQQTITGTVFHDQNENGELEAGESGVANVLVSNGSEIVSTDENGVFEISADDNSIVFVIKPRGWTTHVDEYNIPRFYTILSSAGAGGIDYPGLQPTGSPNDQVNFALYPHEEPDSFRVVIFGDTQARDLDEVGYVANDSVQELIGVDAAFGVTLGDLVFDNLDVRDELNEVVGQIGIPWRHIIGNHDIDYSADTNWDVRGSYMQTYGPSWYAFTWGKTHFVAVDNIRWIVEGDDRYYRTGLGEDQMTFIQNFLDEVPDDEQVFFLMHIPWVHSTNWANEQERDELFELLASHPNTVSFAAHTHRHYHEFIDSDYGWPNDKPHHMVSMGTVCGAWWTGAPDEYGIPHSMMRDGTPRGYAFLEIEEADWKLTYKAARRPADFQMHISAPEEVKQSELLTTEVFANIFNALPDANAEIKIAHGSFTSSWQSMEKTEQPDPFYIAMNAREDSLATVSWRRMGQVNPTPHHLWKTTLPGNLETGTYTIFIRGEDRWNRFNGRKIIRVVE